MADSIFNPDRKLLFRDDFSSEQNTRRLGGVPTGVTYGNGKASFITASNSMIHYPNINYGTYSIRIKINISVIHLGYLFSLTTANQSALCYLKADGTISVPSGTIYVNGINVVSPYTYTTGDKDVIISGITFSSNRFRRLYVGGSYNGFPLTGTMDLFEIYSGTLSAQEVKSLYENKRYKTPNLETLGRKIILDVNAFDGTVRNRLSGNTYGNELVTNGGFDTDTGWNKGSGWIISNGFAVASNASTSLSQSNCVVAGKIYKCRYTINSFSTGWVRIKLGGTVGTNSTAIGTYVEIITATNTTLWFETSGFTGTIDNISVKEVIPSVVNTAISVVKENDRWSPRFNGTTSKISAGSYDTLVGDISVSGWFNAKTLGEGSAGVLINNGQFIVAANATNKRISVTSNNSTVIYSGNNAIDLNDYVHLGITRTSTGVVNIYINGVLSGSANQASGTPVAGSDIIIGNNTGQTATWDGLIPQVKIVSGIMTASELMDEYTANKMSYGL